MNKRQLEMQKEQAACEEKVISRLKQIYEQARKDCEGKIRALSMRTDMENLKSIVWQKQYQEALKKQLDSVLNTLTSEEFACITEYLTQSYENGFWGTLYDLQGQGIPLVFPIDQEQAVRALQVESKLSQGYYKRLGEDTGRLKKAIQTELSRGISNGESWNRMAALIAGGMNSPFRKSYKNAIRIARTEGHRVQNEAAFHCQEKAKAKGADVVKQWDSTLDSRTRPHHVELNGQIRELEEPFEVAGHKAMYPGAFGVPEEDIHCRCCLLQRARWALEGEESYTKWDGDKNTLVSIKAADYNDFKDRAKGIIGGADIDKAAKSDIIKLSDAEQHALNQYLSSDSYRINDKLRRMEPLSEQESAFVRELDNALDKMPEYQGTVHRSVSDFGIEDVDAFIKSYEVGRKKLFIAYMSASLSVYDESFPVQYVIISKHGRDITAYNQKEQEVLFKRGTKFKVLKAEGNTIYMEEV